MTVRLWVAILMAILGLAERSQARDPTLDQRLEALRSAYPNTIKAIEPNAIVLASGTRLVIDDGRTKDRHEKLAKPDIKDMLSQIYPVGKCAGITPPAPNFDPGRIRVTQLFTEMYGGSPADVRARTTTIDWFGERLAVTRINDVDKALLRVREELAHLPQPLQKFFRKSAGTFNWRMIAGTSTPSMHAFAIAIDIDSKFSDYWRWSVGKSGAAKTYRNRIPREVVTAFERHGFIWGGAWYHYDTMHFEYRPELLAIGRLHEKAGC